MPDYHLPSITDDVAAAVARRHHVDAVPVQGAIDAAVDTLEWLRKQRVPFAALTAALARHGVTVAPATLRSMLRRAIQRRDGGRPMPEPLMTLPRASPSSRPIRTAAAAPPSSLVAAPSAAGAPPAREKTDNGIDEVFERVRQREETDRQRLEGGPEFNMFEAFKAGGPKK